jgi:predicted Zn-dependent protease with MMP-like domain
MLERVSRQGRALDECEVGGAIRPCDADPVTVTESEDSDDGLAPIDEQEAEAEAFAEEVYAELDLNPERALELSLAPPLGLEVHPVVRLARAQAVAAAQGEDSARVPLETLVGDHPEFADARHALALVYEALDERERMIEQFVLVRKLDAREDRRAQFDLPAASATIVDVAQRVIEELPSEFRDRLRDVPIIVEARPSLDLVRDGFDPRSLGLFEGADHREPIFDAVGPPPRIVLYAANLTATLDPDDPDALETEVEITVLHEVGHYFGLEEERLHELGLG